VTVGEKIGKEHLTYAQGACAELVAMCTISAADSFGLPVSTIVYLWSCRSFDVEADRRQAEAADVGLDGGGTVRA